ncbi:MAG: 16S rRNA (cytosine(1402)-N(4))-methyltransferase RsmH [Blastocatellia bacterium]|nr:16S rRNA (cytosine(1402)-N(4))-methyltransferase RsmH [Blastocatellia bacterium]
MKTVFENQIQLPTHVPVLLEEVLTALGPERGGWFVDGTLGLGGHTEALLRSSPAVRVLAIDRDQEAAAQALERIAPFRDRVRYVHADYRQLPQILQEQGISSVAGILADLGISSWQLGKPDRGFSFQTAGPLDMRMDPSQGPTAADLVNSLAAEDLANVIFDYGEERASRRIARRIVDARTKQPIETTDQLADLIRKAVPGFGKQRIDPATRTFQALRIAVNRELDDLDLFVSQAIEYLEPAGRLAIITFHSLEDRLIKHAMRQAAGIVETTESRYLPPSLQHQIKPRVTLVTRKPIIATEAEIDRNPRARSAKLRVCEKI